MLYPRRESKLQIHIHGMLNGIYGETDRMQLVQNPGLLHVRIATELISNWQSYMHSLEEELLELVRRS